MMFSFLILTVHIFLIFLLLNFLFFFRIMDAQRCSVCHLRVELCGRRSNRRKVSFEAEIVDEFQQGIVSTTLVTHRKFILL
jgi:hypothetical protein